MDALIEKDKRITQLTDLVSLLSEEKRWMKSQIFGRSSEKHAKDIAVEQQLLSS